MTLSKSRIVPPITCPQWCDDGSVHEGALWVEDQTHRGGELHMHLSQPQHVHGAAEQDCPPEDLWAELWRAYGEQTVILVAMGANCEIKLTLDEARKLAQHITDLSCKGNEP